MASVRELNLAVGHYSTAKPMLDRYMTAALAGDVDGIALAEHQCGQPCPRCMMRCAIARTIVEDLEARIAQHGGMVVRGQAFAFAGRA